MPFAEKAELLLNTPIIPISELCSDLNLNHAVTTGTLTIQQDDWDANLQAKSPPLHSNNIHEAGLYCFWWIGEPALLNEGVLQHWLKGKVVGDDAERVTPPFQEVRDNHIFHKITWQFHQAGSQQNYPMYIGKASSVYKRVRLHLQWPLSAYPGYPRTNAPLEIKPAGNVNSSTQFRKGYEYLFRQMTNQERIEQLIENVGVSFINLPFHDVTNRFFWEDKLIGMLRPPFNLDAER
jgi:hypothetical protein